MPEHIPVFLGGIGITAFAVFFDKHIQEGKDIVLMNELSLNSVFWEFTLAVWAFVPHPKEFTEVKGFCSILIGNIFFKFFT